MVPTFQCLPAGVRRHVLLHVDFLYWVAGLQSLKECMVLRVHQLQYSIMYFDVYHCGVVRFETVEDRSIKFWCTPRNFLIFWCTSKLLKVSTENASKRSICFHPDRAGLYALSPASNPENWLYTVFIVSITNPVGPTQYNLPLYIFWLPQQNHNRIVFRIRKTDYEGMYREKISKRVLFLELGKSEELRYVYGFKGSA